MGSAFTQVLANIYIYIYMSQWEEDLIQYQISHHKIYGRHVVHRIKVLLYNSFCFFLNR